MKYLIILFCFFCFGTLNAQYQKDGLGIKFIQLEGCIKTSNGQPCDSCFVVTSGVNGKLKHCIHISKLRQLINNSAVQDSVLLINNPDGSYTLVNENGTNFDYGYGLEKSGDTIFITDLDGTRADSVIVVGGAGEANTASNQGLTGLGWFHSKVGVDLQFKNIDSASSKITIFDNIANKTIDIDVNEGELDLNNIGGLLDLGSQVFGILPVGSLPGFTGDVTAPVGSNVLTIAYDSVSFPLMQNINTDRLLGRDSSGVGNVSEITVGPTIQFNGTNSIDRAALVGDVTAPAGSNQTTIANDSVSFAQMQNVTGPTLIGKPTAGSGDIQLIKIGNFLYFSNDTLHVDTSGIGGGGTDTDNQKVDSFYISNDTIFLSLEDDADTIHYLVLPTVPGTTNVIGLSGNEITSNVNGVSDTTLVIGDNQLTNNGVNTMTSTINGVASSVGIINYVTHGSLDNSITVNVNGLPASTNIINNDTLSLSGNVMTHKINTVISDTSLVIGELNTNLAGNILTTEVNSVTDTSLVIGTHIVSISGSILTSQTNGVSDTALIPTQGTTNNIVLNGNQITSTVNGVSDTTVSILTNSLGISGNTMTSSLNGVSDTSLIIGTVNGNLSGNTQTINVNGVTDTVLVVGKVNANLSGNVITVNTNDVTDTTLVIGKVNGNLSGNTITLNVNDVTDTTLVIGKVNANLSGNTITINANDVTDTTQVVGAISHNYVDGVLTTTINGAISDTAQIPTGGGGGNVSNGGNSFGAAFIVGSNDNNTVSLEVQDTTAFSLGTDQAITTTINSSNTTTLQNILTQRCNSYNTPGGAGGFGVSELTQLETTTTDNQDAVQIDKFWNSATHATMSSTWTLKLRGNGGAMGDFLVARRTTGQPDGEILLGAASALTIRPTSFTTAAPYTIGGSSSLLTLGGSSGGVTISSNSTNNIAIHNSVNASTSTAGIVFGNSLNFVQSSGTRNYIDFTTGFQPTSGTAVHNKFLFAGTFNQTGGANGITRALYFNHTLTTVTDYRTIDIAESNANATYIYQSGTLGKNIFTAPTNIMYNAFINSQSVGVLSVATAAGTTTLTVNSPQVVYLTGVTTQTVVLPAATTLRKGCLYKISPVSGTGLITVQTNGGATLWTVAGGSDLDAMLVDTSTAAGTWELDYRVGSSATGKASTFNNSFTFNGTDATTMTFPSTNANVVGETQTQTLTNKRITKRSGTTASTASLTIDSDATDIYTVTALAAAMTINAPTGTPTVGQTIILRIKDDGTARALTWNAAFVAIGVTLPSTTVANKLLYVGFIWNATSSKWDVVSVNQEA